jgi:type II secretory pathway predicted ATPase ExeA
MYKNYWAMEYNPFLKNNIKKNKKIFETSDYINVITRLEHLKKLGGIGLLTGLSGTGKTYTLKKFADNLNPSLYKVVYIPLSTVTVLEFYKSLAYGLDLDPPNKKIDIFRNIQERIISLVKDKKITPVILVDEAQYLKTNILNDIKLLLNFEMDSKDYAVFLLVGQPLLNNILSKRVHEPLNQRIIMNYNFQGITKKESKEYIIAKLKECGIYNSIIEENALEAIASCGSGSIRKINSIVDKCLIIGAMEKVKTINTDIVMNAQNEIELI